MTGILAARVSKSHPAMSPEAALRAMLADVTLKPCAHIGLDDDLQRTLALDSLSVLRLVADVEAAFDIRIPDDEFHRLRTLRVLLEYVT